MFLIVFFVTILVLCLLFAIGRSEDNNGNAIPGLPLLRLLKFWGTWKSSSDLSRKIMELHQEFGPIFKIHIKPFKPVIFTTKAEFIEKILISKDHLEKPYLYEVFHPFARQGIATIQSAHEWKVDRKLFIRAMGHGFLNQILFKTVCYINQFSESIKNELSNRPIDIQIRMHDMLLNVLLETISASSIRHDWERVNDYGKARERFFQLTMERIMSIFMIPDTLFKLSRKYKAVQEACQVSTAFAKELLHQHKLIQESMIDHHNFVQVLIDGGMSDDKIVDNINTVIEAGHDTTALSLTWMLYELSRNKVVQDNILQETIALLGPDPEKDISLQDIQEMKYIERFVIEMLRYYTIMNFLARKIGRSVNINNIELPEGSTIVYATHAVHMSEDYYDNPTVFNPDRFLSKNGVELNHNTYVPFPVGPRNCIAKTIAIQQLKLIVAKLVRTFEITPYEHVMDIDTAPLRKSRNGVFVILSCRSS